MRTYLVRASCVVPFLATLYTLYAVLNQWQSAHCAGGIHGGQPADWIDFEGGDSDRVVGPGYDAQEKAEADARRIALHGGRPLRAAAQNANQAWRGLRPGFTPRSFGSGPSPFQEAFGNVGQPAPARPESAAQPVSAAQPGPRPAPQPSRAPSPAPAPQSGTEPHSSEEHMPDATASGDTAEETPLQQPATKKQRKQRKQPAARAPETYEAPTPFTAEERTEVVNAKRDVGKDNTIGAYDNQWTKLMEYCELQSLDPDIFAVSEGPATAARFVKWMHDGAPGGTWKGKDEKWIMSESTWKQLHSMLADNYRTAQVSHPTTAATGAELREDPVYRAVYDRVTKSYHQKGARSGDADPQDGTTATAITFVEWKALNHAFLSVKASDRRAQVANAERDKALCTLGYQTVARSDELREVRLPDLLPPAHIECVGPCPAISISLTLRNSKTAAGGKVAYKVALRHRDPELCSQGSLARYGCVLFTLSQMGFPRLPMTSAADWANYPLWKTRGRQSISYGAQLTAIARWLKEASVNCGRAVTHAFRTGGAQMLDRLGLAAATIMRMGNWSHDTMYKHYLYFAPTDGLLAAGGWPGAESKNYGNYFHERFMVEIPEALIYYVYPWLKDLDEDLAKMGDSAGTSVRSAALLWRYLAHVLVQDSLELVGLYPDQRVHIFLMANPEFVKLLNKYHADKKTGRFEEFRPQTQAQQQQRMYVALGAYTSALAARNQTMTEFTVRHTLWELIGEVQGRPEPINEAGPEPELPAFSKQPVHPSFGGLVQPTWTQRDQDEVAAEQEDAMARDLAAMAGAGEGGGAAATGSSSTPAAASGQQVGAAPGSSTPVAASGQHVAQPRSAPKSLGRAFAEFVTGRPTAAAASSGAAAGPAAGNPAAAAASASSGAGPPSRKVARSAAPRGSFPADLPPMGDVSSVAELNNLYMALKDDKDAMKRIKGTHPGNQKSLWFKIEKVCVHAVFHEQKKNGRTRHQAIQVLDFERGPLTVDRFMRGVDAEFTHASGKMMPKPPK